jgi:glycosyltransferase involved in cell wall biosynthesis
LERLKCWLGSYVSVLQAELRGRYRALKGRYGELKVRYRELKVRYAELKERYGVLKGRYAAVKEYRDSVKNYGLIHIQCFLGDIALRLKENLSADCYISLLPLGLPAAFLLRNSNGGVVVCDAVENIEADKRSLKPNCPPSALEIINHAAYGAMYECDKIITVSDALGETLRRFNRPCLVLKNYRQHEDIKPSDYLHNTCRLSDRDVVLFTSGNIVIGFEPILKALSLLPKNYQLVALARIKPASYEKEIQVVIDKCDLRGQVHFLPFVDYRLLASVAAEADIGLIASDINNPNAAVGLPNRLFDYLAAGLPVIGPAMPDVKKLIEENGFGRIVHPISPENWKDAILAISKDMPLYKQNAQRAKEKLTWEMQEKAFYDFIGRPGIVTMICYRDGTRYQRVIRMAATLNKFGCKVKILTVADNPKIDGQLPDIEYYCINKLKDSRVEPIYFSTIEKRLERLVNDT